MISALIAATLPGISLAEALARVDQVAEVEEASAEALARAREVEVTSIGAPLTFTVGGTRYSAQRTFHLGREFRWAGQRGYALSAASFEADASSAGTEDRRREALREIRLAWLDLASAEDGAKLAAEITRRAAELTQTIEEREAAGKVPRLDLVRARAAQARIAAESATLDQRTAAAGTKLALLIALPLDAAVATDGNRPPAPGEDDLNRLAGDAGLESHPALQAAEARLAAAEARSRAEARNRLPGLALDVGLEQDDPGLPGDDRTAALSMTIPLAGAASASASVAERDAEAARVAALRRDLRTELDAALRRALGARAQLTAYDDLALPAAVEAATLTSEAYDAGRGEIWRVIEVGRALLDARIARHDAYFELLRAEADLRYVSGVADVTP